MFQHDLMHSGRSNYVGPQTNNVKWSYQTGGRIRCSPAIGIDGTIYVGSDDGYLYAINPDGALKWKFNTGNQIWSAPAIGSDGTIYINSSYYLYAINPDGTQKWRFSIDGWARTSSPAIGNDGTIYVGGGDFYLYAITDNGTTGIQKWRFRPSNEYSVWSSPAIGSDGTIYVGSNSDANFYAINPSGQLKWRLLTGVVTSSPAISGDGTIYFGNNIGNNNGYLCAITDNATAGIQKWQFGTVGIMESSPAIGSDGTIYVGSDDNYLYAVNPDGTKKWSYGTGGEILASPAIGNDGTIYVHSLDGNLYAISSGGTHVWSYMTGESPTGPWVVDSSAAIGSDGTLYIGAWDGKLYAFQDIHPNASVNTSLGVINFTTSAGSISGLANIPPESMPCSSGGFIFPYGMFSYSITNLAPGATATVTITTPVAVPMGAKVFKCQNGSLTDFSQYVQQPDPNTFILTLKDGGQGDSDGVANGIIVDPCGPAFPFVNQGHSSSAGGPSLTSQAPMAIANIAVQSASLSAARVAPGAAVTVTTDIANKGTASGSNQITLYVNGQEEAHQGITLTSGSHTPIKFTVSRDKPGSYSVYVGSIPAGTFEVDQFADPNLVLYISGALMLFALAGGVIFIATRRHR
jgi:outer membrane protein assembly factor BamB